MLTSFLFKFFIKSSFIVNLRVFKKFGNSAAFPSATTSSELLDAPARYRLGEPIESLNLISWCVVQEKCSVLACYTLITDCSEGTVALVKGDGTFCCIKWLLSLDSVNW